MDRGDHRPSGWSWRDQPHLWATARRRPGPHHRRCWATLVDPTPRRQPGTQPSSYLGRPALIAILVVLALARPATIDANDYGFSEYTYGTNIYTVMKDP